VLTRAVVPWPQGDCLWFGVDNHTTTPQIFLRVYNQDGSGKILQKPFWSACARASLLAQTIPMMMMMSFICSSDFEQKIGAELKRRLR
jgi:hypothetical protein